MILYFQKAPKSCQHFTLGQVHSSSLLLRNAAALQCPAGISSTCSPHRNHPNQYPGILWGMDFFFMDRHSSHDDNTMWTTFLL